MPRRKERFRPVRKCEHPDCDVFFRARMRFGAAPRYCSPACKKDHWFLRNPEKVKESQRRKLEHDRRKTREMAQTRPSRECENRQCQRTFRPRSKVHIYCSKRCRQRAHHVRCGHVAPPELVLCPGCDMYFERTRKGHLYCTTACGDAARRGKEKERTGDATA